jgi:hypothetical protein
MKQKIISFCAGVLMSALCAGFAACNEPKGPELQGEDIPFTVYSSVENAPGEDLSDRWIKREYFDAPWGEGKIFIVNSAKELEKYVDGGHEYHSVDFSTKTLLLVGGTSYRSPVIKTIRSFKSFSENKYELKIEIEQGMFMMGEIWRMAILTDKISSKSKIELDIVTIND